MHARRAPRLPAVRRRAGGHAVELPIPARDQAPESPRSGWCGETAIQEALLYNGAFYPQRRINRAGRPQNPDLYASDIPRALRALGVDFVRYSWAKRGFQPFYKWLRSQLRGGRPVLVGMKIHPTQHPRWGLDHFALAVGYDTGGLTVNTTWGRRARRTLKQLTTRAKGLSFKNPYDRYYGLSLRGVTGRPATDRPVRLLVRRETRRTLWVTVKCEGLRRGGAYEVVRFAQRSRRAKPVSRWTFVAAGSAKVLRDTVDKRRPALYRCRPATPRGAP